MSHEGDTSMSNKAFATSWSSSVGVAPLSFTSFLRVLSMLEASLLGLMS